MNIKEQRDAVLKSARELVDRVKNENRDLTEAERTKCDEYLAKADELGVLIKKAEVDQSRLKQIGDLGGAASGSKGFLRFKPKELADDLIYRHVRGGVGVKSLVGAGDSLVGLPLLAGSPVDMGRPATSLFDVIPAEEVTREFAYLRQTTRTNLAAPVASGALKPTSVYTLERIEDHLRVIAHLSEPVDEFWMRDNATLTGFVESELFLGVALAIENQVINGDSLGENFTGLNDTSGVLTQAWTTDRLLTARNGKLATETAVGDLPGFFVLNPTDWAAIETTVVGSSGYAMAAAGQQVPVESATKRLWGSPVVTANSQAAGVGWFVQNDSVRLFFNGSVRVEWDRSGDDFDRNLLRARCEGRFKFVATRPVGIVKLDLTAV